MTALAYPKDVSNGLVPTVSCAKLSDPFQLPLAVPEVEFALCASALSVCRPATSSG
jgi:hypothetical protein